MESLDRRTPFDPCSGKECRDDGPCTGPGQNPSDAHSLGEEADQGPANGSGPEKGHTQYADHWPPQSLIGGQLHDADPSGSKHRPSTTDQHERDQHQRQAGKGAGAQHEPAEGDA